MLKSETKHTFCACEEKNHYFATVKKNEASTKKREKIDSVKQEPLIMLLKPVFLIRNILIKLKQMYISY